MSRYGISVPTRDVGSLQRVSSQLKEAVEAILGYRGSLYSGIQLPTSDSGGGSDFDYEALLEYLQTVETRLVALEETQQRLVDTVTFILDGTHAFGYEDTRYRHAPATSPSNPNTRLSFSNTSVLSNVTHPDSYSFSPQYEGDFTIFAYLNFEADSSGDEWYIQGFRNGSGIGDPFFFKPDEVGGGTYVQFFLQHVDHFEIGDVVDLRLWPDDSGKGGFVESFTYQMVGLGIDVTV